MAALFCASKLSLSGSASFRLEMLFPFTPCVSARVNTSVPCVCGICRRSSVSPVSSSVSSSLFPSAASSHTHVSLSEISASVCPLHLAAFSSGGRSRCVCLWVGRPHPSFLFSYHCSTAALSGKQPFHRPLLRGAPVGAGTALPDPPCGNDRPRLSVILGTLLACADQAVLALFCTGPSAQRSAADRRHLVCACAAGLPASAALTPNNRPQLQTSGFLLLLLAVTDPTLAS